MLTAFSYARAGNYIDFGAIRHVDEKSMDKMTWQEFQQWQRWDEFPERADNPPLTVDVFFLSEGKG